MYRRLRPRCMQGHERWNGVYLKLLRKCFISYQSIYYCRHSALVTILDRPPAPGPCTSGALAVLSASFALVRSNPTCSGSCLLDARGLGVCVLSPMSHGPVSDAAGQPHPCDEPQGPETRQNALPCAPPKPPLSALVSCVSWLLRCSLTPRLWGSFPSSSASTSDLVVSPVFFMHVPWPKFRRSPLQHGVPMGSLPLSSLRCPASPASTPAPRRPFWSRARRCRCPSQRSPVSSRQPAERALPSAGARSRPGAAARPQPRRRKPLSFPVGVAVPVLPACSRSARWLKAPPSVVVTVTAAGLCSLALLSLLLLAPCSAISWLFNKMHLSVSHSRDLLDTMLLLF